MFETNNRQQIYYIECAALAFDENKTIFRVIKEPISF